MHLSTLLFVLVLANFISAKSKSCKVKKNLPKVVSGYYAGHASDLLPVNKIPWGQLTHLVYSVALPQEGPDILPLVENEDNMRKVIAGAKANNVTISIGVMGSNFFSTNAGNVYNRTVFGHTLAHFVHNYSFDGIEMIWHHPNQEPGRGNITSQTNTTSANLLIMLRRLRINLGPKLRISAALPSEGLIGPDGLPLKNYTRFARVLDHVTIMPYDVYSPGKTNYTGPNAPLYDTCGAPDHKDSARRSIATYINSSFPASKIILGIPSYGYSFNTSSSTLTPTRFSINGSFTSLIYQNVSSEILPGSISTTSNSSLIDQYVGVKKNVTTASWLFQELIDTGKLRNDTHNGTNGYLRYYDTCSKTPFLFDSKTQNLISYEDPMSFRLKAKFVNRHRLAGVNVFPINGDTSDSVLLRTLNAILKNETTISQ